MRFFVFLLSVRLLAIPVSAAVEVYVEQGNGLAWIKYQCTAGEVVRAFALDVSVDQGRIVGISDFFVGESTAAAQGYGIFPASIRNHIRIGPGTNLNWDVEGYAPLAAVADNPGDTLPGLGSAGVTLEFGGLWDPAVPAAIPGPMGTLCALQMSQGATVSVSANESRGGVLLSDPVIVLTPVFRGTFVQPPEITRLSWSNGVLRILYAGGRLEAATTLNGPWITMIDDNGEHHERVGVGTNKFFRVRCP